MISNDFIIEVEDRSSPYAVPLKKPQASATNVKKKSKFNNVYNENTEVDMSQGSYPVILFVEEKNVNFCLGSIKVKIIE